ncbi:MAG: SxtJ family membrane protein [Planctomycetota bacterium]|jgi:predicted Kef-type K+ transport protein
MIDLKRNPSRRELFWFGAMFAAFFALVGALIRWKLDAPVAAAVVWGVAGAIAAGYYVLPSLRRPLYAAWMLAAFPIGWLISHVLLAVVYYVVLTATGLVMRLLGHDPMQRRLDPDASSYWVEHNPGADRARYFRQF